MYSHRRPVFSVMAATVSVCFVLCFQARLYSQQPDDKEKTDDGIREQTIYIPFSQLRDVFEKEGRGVFLPYDDFKKLWDSARAAQSGLAATDEKTAPFDAMISEISSEVTVANDVARVESKLNIELLKKGWNTIPLRLSGAAIESATIGGEKARVTAGDGGYQLNVKNEKDDSSTIQLDLVYVRAYTKSPGQNSVSFSAPQAPVNRWVIRVPGEDVKIQIDPMIAASEAEESDLAGETTDDPELDSDQKETVLLAFVGAAPSVSIRWTAKSEGATGMSALTSVQATQELYIAEGSVRTRATLNYAISRSQISQLVVEVPANQKVVNVFDANVRKWDVEPNGEIQTITVDLFEPVSTSQGLSIELEKFVDESMMEEIHAPMIRARNVVRQQGTLVMQTPPSLRTEPTRRTGLLQIDPSELPASLANKDWALAYRYASPPYDLRISVEKVKPQINVQQLVEYYLQSDSIVMQTLVGYEINQSGVFSLELDLPSGFEVTEVVGKAIPNGVPAAVDSYRISGENQDRLIVSLARKAQGNIGLAVQLRKPLDDENLLSPTGVTSLIDLPIPEANQQYRNQYAGHLVVYAPESLRLTPETTNGLRAVSFGEAFERLGSVRSGRFPATRPTLAFACTQQPKQLAVNVLRRSPSITVRQMVITRVDSGVVKFDVTLFYEILYSGVNSLRIDLPSRIADDVRNLSGSIRESQIDPEGEDLDEGYVAWKMSGESELIGNHRIHLTWEESVDELAVGKSLDLTIPRIVPRGTDRAWGQIVYTKAETLDVRPSGEPDGLRPIDPLHDLMPGVNVPDAAAAMEFHDDWNLQLTATRYRLEEMKRTSIERALVQTVVTRSDQRTVSALYRIRSAKQRLTLKLPEAAEFDTQPVRVNGSPVSLERGEQDLLYIPLIGQDPNREFILELRYSIAGDHRRISIPEFPDEPAIQKVFLAVYLPEERAVLGVSGDWTEEYEWKQQASYRWVPKPSIRESRLQRWISEGLSVGTSPAFQKDGTLFLFSALRPDPPPDGDLRLVATNENLLSGMVIVVLFLVGLLFLRSSVSRKFVVIASFFILAIGIGLFLPTFGQQLLGASMYAGITVIAIVWGLWTLFQVKKQYKLINPVANWKSSSKPVESSSSQLAKSETDVSSEPTPEFKEVDEDE